MENIIICLLIFIAAAYTIYRLLVRPSCGCGNSCGCGSDKQKDKISSCGQGNCGCGK